MPSSRTRTVAVLGLGEAGSAIAGDLVDAGAVVRGYDPAVSPPQGVVATGSEAEAASGADIVLSVNSAKAAIDALRAGVEGVASGAVWADMNTGAPDLKRRLAEIASRFGFPFADVAIMAPVPGRGLRTPMLASGDGAELVAEIMEPFGASVEAIEGEPGLAASKKLLRSVFFKGMAGAVVEALEAARAAGCEQWLRENIVAELTAADAAAVDRWVEGTYRHSVRRVTEMAAATDMLIELGVQPHVAAASRDLLKRLSGEG